MRSLPDYDFSDNLPSDVSFSLGYLSVVASKKATASEKASRGSPERPISSSWHLRRHFEPVGLKATINRSRILIETSTFLYLNGLASLWTSSQPTRSRFSGHSGEISDRDSACLPMEEENLCPLDSCWRCRSITSFLISSHGPRSVIHR